MILYGASGHAKVIIEILEQQGLKIEGLIDANPNVTQLLGYPVYPPGAQQVIDNVPVIIAIGNNVVRKKLAGQAGNNFGNAVHPSANISVRSVLGAGCVVMAGVCVNSSAEIGQHVILNTGCSVDHDCKIADYVHISPKAALAGNVIVGEGTHIGIGACVKQGLTIGKWATIGAGAVIINDVTDYAVVVGNPGRIIKYNNEL
ncbi:MAG: acetyltransferase [Sphingobacteriales bacterium]|nr:MAG: acetyltransferase [Sphingobacteriales bacterium]